VDGPLEELRRRGIEAYPCDETTLEKFVKPDSVGVAHLFHVIEHLPNVNDVLKAIHKVLAPGGVLIGQTPNVESLGRRVWGDLWNQWHAPQHLVLFSDSTLTREAERAGFEVVKISSSISGATQWALSTLHLWARFRGRPFRHIHEPMYPPLILAAIPIAMFEAIFSRTCHMDFVLRKPA
jgi:SAM-dependent methyltransferase